uniref:Capsid triplex subunit 1 n=1 Tax=Human herpesvirus 2 TaxID=10310 RepID=A0A0Y0REJ4_HHV2|nr:capsid triplex subunit 1 [Human alphaherpesvirus 2]
MWLLGIDPAESSPGTRATRDDTEQAVDKILRGARRAGGLTVPGAPRYHLTRQVTLTDLCQPNAERAGALLLALRHPTDLPHLARHRAPPGRQTERLAEAWGQLLEASALGSGRAESGCARAGLVSFNFLVAACAAAYDARDAAEAVRAHITTNYGGTRAGARLDRFSECLRAMVHTHVFPHEVMRFFGGLVSWVTQDELASVTAVCSGPQEATHTGHPGRPCSAVTIPACAFVDLDAELCLGGPGAAFLYLVFTYRQCRDQELCCVYVVKSQLPPRGLEAALAHTPATRAGPVRPLPSRPAPSWTWTPSCAWGALGRRSCTWSSPTDSAGTRSSVACTWSRASSPRADWRRPSSGCSGASG